MNHRIAKLASTSESWRVAARQLCQVFRQAEKVVPHSGIDLDDTWTAWRIGTMTWELRDSRPLSEGGERYGPSSLAEAVYRWLAFLEDGTCGATLAGPEVPAGLAGRRMSKGSA